MSGIGIAAIGPKDVMSWNTLTYLASAALLLPIHFRARTATEHIVKQKASMAMLDAIRFTFVASPAIAPLIVIASLYTFGTAALTTLLPVFGKALFQFGPVEVGYFWSALGVGFLLVSLALLFVSEWSLRLRVHLLAVSSAVAGVALVVLLSTKTVHRRRCLDGDRRARHRNVDTHCLGNSSRAVSYDHVGSGDGSCIPRWLC